MKICFTALFLLTAGIVLGDIPDCTLQWDFLTIIEKQGNDILCDCIMSDDSSSFKLVYSSSTEGGMELWMLELDRSGEIISRTGLLTEYFEQIDWTVPGFVDDSTLAIAYGFHSEVADTELQVIDLSDPGARSTISLNGWSPDSRTVIRSLKPAGSNRLQLLGTSWSPDKGTSLFVSEIDLNGTIHWRTTIIDSLDIGINKTTLRVLDDGGCMLSYCEDCSISGLPVVRLDEDGQQVWDNFIEMNCEFTADFDDFTELDDGSILCTGSFNSIGQMAYRGILVCLNPSGSELWRREDWYQDHTSFVSAEPAPEGSIMITGWTGTEGDYAFEVADKDVLVAKLDAAEESITGFLIEEAGDQNPRFVYAMGEGEFFIVGEHTPDNNDESDIFLGRVFLSPQKEDRAI